MSEILLLFADSEVPWQDQGSQTPALAVQCYTVADHQPVPVHLGLRPGCPYSFLTIVKSAAPLSQQDIARFLARHPIRAHWCYTAITEQIHRPADAALPRHLHLAFTNPAQGREGEFNAWYSGDHLSHALLADGFVTAQRFVLHNPGGETDGTGASSPYQYLTVYGLRTADLRESEDDMHRFASGEKPGMPLSDALGPVRATWVFTPIA